MMEFLGGVFVFLTLILFLLAVIGLIHPKLIKQQNRKQVLLRFLLPVPVLFVLAGILLPEPPADSTTSNVEKTVSKEQAVEPDKKAEEETASKEQEAKEKAEKEAKQAQEVKEKEELAKKAKAEQEAKEKEELAEKAKAEQEAKEKEKKWYSGGTLHKINALAWQEATDQNKLATCADTVSMIWSEKALKEEISSKLKSIDDLKPLAQSLVNGLNEAFKRDPDDEKNKLLFANQNVSKTALLLAIQMGWLKSLKK